MQMLNCLIVEDEPLAAKVISDYAEEIPGLSIKAICKDVFIATEELRKNAIDIIFLDINLPKISGLDFIKTMPARPHIILTTAYHEYAIEGFNLNVVDYLLKPVEFSRFLQAINKVFDLKRINTLTSQTDFSDEHYFNVDKKKVKVRLSEIIYIESVKDYVKLQLAERNIVTRFNISDMMSLLPSSFIRVHKSYIINSAFITAFSSTDIESGKFIIPIGRTYKELVEKRLSPRAL